MNSIYTEILYNYFLNKDYSIYFDRDAINIFDKHLEHFNKICGLLMDVLDGPFQDMNENEIRMILVNNKTELPCSLFMGEITQTEHQLCLESHYTCSTEIEKGGILLRFLAFLIANEKNSEIKLMSGAISGGIPPLDSNNTHEEAQKKKQNLINYHKKYGATVENDMFIYHIDKVKEEIIKVFEKKAGRKSKRKHKSYKRYRKTKTNKRYRKTKTNKLRKLRIYKPKQVELLKPIKDFQ